MPPQGSRPTLSLLLVPLFVFPHLGMATLSLQQIQAIAEFPPSCLAAYQSPIPSCPDASAFTSGKSGSGSSPCTTDCFNALNKAVISIQKACQNTAAPPGTVIAHAFTGDLASFLCSMNNGGGGGGTPASSDTASKTSITTAASIGPSTIALSSSVESTSKITSQPDPSSSNTATTTVASNTVVTSTVPPASTTTTVSKISASNSKASSSSSPRASQSINGGSPFDQVVPSGASPAQVSQAVLSLVFGLTLAIVLDIRWR